MGEDETVAEANRDNNNHLPFAVVGSSEFIKVGNKNVRARQYPWGVVQVENENHCDFTRLREMLIRTNMEDLIDTTHSRHYELYRKDRLKMMGFEEKSKDGKPSSFAETYTMRRESHLASLHEREVHAKFDKLKVTVADEKRIVEDQRRALDEEI